ncbi:MAG TPA: acylphosphatase [Gemmatimonadales bacterium]
MAPERDQGVRWLVSGSVQGVGFRWFVARHARRLGLTGSVRNLPDGRVEVSAFGPELVLQALERELRKGPLSARVDDVEKSDTELNIDGHKPFEIN